MRCALAVLALLTFATPAGAAVRHASPGTSGDCVNAPCDFVTAVSGAGPGDEVVVAPGDYGSVSLPIGPAASFNSIQVHGQAGKPRPRIFAQPASPTFSALALYNPGATVKHLEITAVGSLTSSNALGLYGGSGEDLVVRSNVSTGFSACYLENGSVLRSSACWTPSIQNPPSAVGTDWQGSPSTVVTLRNVTAVGLGLGAAGLYELTSSGSSVRVYAVNSVIEGYVSVALKQQAGAGSARFTPTYSNVVGPRDFAGGCCTEDASSTNLPNNAVFVNLAGDFHQDPASPTVNRGTDSGLGAATDFDGQPRSFGGRTDIGADELVRPPSAITLAATAVSANDATLRGRANPRGVNGTRWYFLFGRTTAYPLRTVKTTLTSDAKPVPVARALIGFKPRTLYHYRLVVDGPGGRTAGADRTFTTKPPFTGLVLPASQTVTASKGVAAVRAACPASVYRRCTGSLALSRKTGGGKRVALGKAGFAIASGKTRSVPVPLNEAAAKRLADRGTIAARADALTSDGSFEKSRTTHGKVTLEAPGKAARRLALVR
ncbi:MAG: choice-of-anchor Q domain-containing protein [Thermoleophilaceae bacterium]